MRGGVGGETGPAAGHAGNMERMALRFHGRSQGSGTAGTIRPQTCGDGMARSWIHQGEQKDTPSLGKYDSAELRSGRFGDGKRRCGTSADEYVDRILGEADVSVNVLGVHG